MHHLLSLQPCSLGLHVEEVVAAFLKVWLQLHTFLFRRKIFQNVKEKCFFLTLHRDNDGGSEAQAELLLAPRGGGGRGCRLEHVVHVDHLPPAAVVVHQIIQSDRVAPEVSGACQEDIKLSVC